MNETPPQIRDIIPPVPVSPYPEWMVALAIAITVLVLCALGYLLRRYIAKRNTTPPPTPREQALRDLSLLRQRVEETEPRTFSSEVSDVLRTYLTRQFGLRATQQTTEEFFADLQTETLFSPARRDLLTRFLTRCDLIKFAKAESGTAESEALLEDAVTFIQEGDAPAEAGPVPTQNPEFFHSVERG